MNLPMCRMGYNPAKEQMKNNSSKRLLAIIILLSMISIDVLASLPESNRYKPKPNRKSGILIRPECSWGIFSGYDNGIISQDAVSVAYQFNPYFSLGGGSGVNLSIFNLNYRPYWYAYPMHFEGNGTKLGNVILDGVFPVYSLPLFLNTRVLFCDRKWSPFVDFKLGYNLALSNKKVYEVYYDNQLVYKRAITTNGISAAITLGAQYKIFSFGVTTGYFTTLNDIWEAYGYSYDDEPISLTTYHEGHESRYNYMNFSLLLYFSWDIPVGRK